MSDVGQFQVSKEVFYKFVAILMRNFVKVV